jgi:hypothetical protein
MNLFGCNPANDTAQQLYGFCWTSRFPFGYTLHETTVFEIRISPASQVLIGSDNSFARNHTPRIGIGKSKAYKYLAKSIGLSAAKFNLKSSDFA